MHTCPTKNYHFWCLLCPFLEVQAARSKKMDRFHHSFMSPISQLHHQVGYKLKIPYKISIKSD